ncbi:MAG TPA: hypothetical protein VG826_32700 [Pirellulales bacterium]|nr:hypothetical protein [Pirellulales bacterium]
MRIDRLRLCTSTLAQLLLLVWPLCAQTPSPSGKADREEKPAGRSPQAVERVEPDIYYTRDKNGELVPLLTESLEDIRKLLERRDGVQAAPRASFRVERLVISAEAVGDNATLSAELSIVASDPGWVRVPLRLGQLFLTQPPEFADEGEHYVDFENETREYVAWLRGKAGQSHRLLLRGLARLESDGSQTRLRLSAPRAVFSEIRFLVPVPSATGQIASGGVLAETQRVGGGTQFRATGLANDFLLSWRQADARQVESPTVFSADSQIRSHVDHGAVDTSATLSVNAFGREFAGFRVRLPRGATLVPADQPDYSVTQIAPGPDAPKDERGVVEVKLKTKSSSAVKVEIKTRQGYDSAREGAFELGGFEVLGAARQSGFLAVYASDDWQVAFTDRQGVLQTDELPSGLSGDDVVAGFNYFGQPYSLAARVSPRQSRTSVDPTYVVEVAPHHLQLEGSLKYHIAGAKVRTFSIELGDWQLDQSSLEPVALVNAAALVFSGGNSVLIPLKQGATGDVELKLRARKPIPAEADTISWSMPRVAADSVGSTDLVVIAEDNVVLTPRPAEMSGLSSAPPNPNVKLAARQQAPWYYRSDVPDPRFVAGLHVASRRLTSHVESQVNLVNGSFKINQKIVCAVAYEAADSLLLVMPPSLAKTGQISVAWQKGPLSLDPAPSEEAGGELAGMRVRFPEPQSSQIELDISYDWPDEALGELLARAATVRTEIPLVMPGEGECTSNKLTLLASPRLHLEPVDKEWTLDEIAPHESDRRQRLVFSNSQPRTTLALGVSPQPSEVNDSLVVERAWIQTWLTDERRFDRAVFRFHTRENRLRLRLPPGCVTESFRLDDDADVTVLAGESPEEHVFTLPDSGAPDASHVLEVTCQVESRPAGAGHFSLTLPELVGPARQVYWQLVLPRSEYLVSGPPDLVDDFAWVFNGLGWSRQPLLETGELEAWSGSREQEGPLPSLVNTYLFSGRAPPAHAEITTVSRPFLVLVPSGLLLAAGLTGIYFPPVRRPASLFVAGVGALAVAALWPDMSLLAAQAAVWGGALVGLAAVLEQRWRRRSAPVPLRNSPSSIVSRSSTHSYPRAGAPAGLSTQTAALAIDLGTEAKT